MLPEVKIKPVKIVDPVTGGTRTMYDLTLNGKVLSGFRSFTKREAELEKRAVEKTPTFKNLGVLYG